MSGDRRFFLCRETGAIATKNLHGNQFYNCVYGISVELCRAVMTTIQIRPMSDENGNVIYQAIAGNQLSVGTTAGQALDALTAMIGEQQGSFWVVSRFEPDTFFSATQQARLAELMGMWRSARDTETVFPEVLQTELDELVEAELQASIARAKSLVS